MSQPDEVLAAPGCLPRILRHGEAIDYADGAEATLLAFFTEHETGEYAIHPDEVDWPLFYHLTPQRKSLVNWIDFGEGALDILELGAGCGAVSTHFAALPGARLTAVEGALGRARVIQQRLKNADNVTILCGELGNLPLDARHDVVSCIGVLEYAGAFSGRMHPHRHLLGRMRSWLKDDGCLVLAIENQLGHKYLAGFPEDHHGRPFEGVNGYPSGDRVRTFTRAALEEMLREAGFAHQLWFHPSPDYKTPTTVLGDRAFSRPEFDPLPFFALPTRHYDDAVRPAFNERAFVRQVAELGQAQAFTNSFLILASPSAEAPLLERNRHVLAARVNVRERAQNFQTRTLFVEDAHQNLTVRRERMHPAYATEFAEARHVLQADEPYAHGAVNLHERILDAVLAGRFEQGFAHVRQWHDTLRSLARPGTPEDRAAFGAFASRRLGGPAYAKAPDLWLEGRFLDLHPGNLFLSRRTSEPFFIDLEWRLAHRVPLQLVFDRGLNLLAQTLEAWTPFIPAASKPWPFLPHELARDLKNLEPFATRDTDSLRRFEAWFQHAVQHGNLDLSAP